jgi:hypothetical protein
MAASISEVIGVEIRSLARCGSKRFQYRGGFIGCFIGSELRSALLYRRQQAALQVRLVGRSLAA